MPHQCTDCSHVFPDGSKAMLSGCPDCGGNTFQFLPEGAVPDGELDAGDVDAARTATDSDPRTDADESAGTAPSPSESGRVPVESAEPTTTASTATTGDISDTGDADDATDGAPTAPPEPPRGVPPSRGRLERATEALRSFVFDSPTSAPRPEPDRASDPGENADAVQDSGPDDAVEPVDSSTRNGGDEPAENNRTPGPDTEANTKAGNRTDLDSRADVDVPEDAPSTPPDATDGTDTGVPPAGLEDGRIAAEPSGPSTERPDLEELRQELNDQFESIKIVEPGQYELNLMELYNREEYIIALREDGRYAIEAPESWLGRRIDRK